MRRALAPLLAILALVLFAIPASAGGAVSVTQNFHGAFPTMQVGPLCNAPGGTLAGSGNAVFHTTVNAAGDAWGTSTQEEWFTLTPFDPALPVYTGHYAIWFGFSANNRNFVVHDIANVQATGSDGSTLSLHLVDHFSVSADGHITAFSMGCS